MIVAIIFGTTSRERLVRGLSPTNCDSPAVKSRNNHYKAASSGQKRTGFPPSGISGSYRWLSELQALKPRRLPRGYSAIIGGFTDVQPVCDTNRGGLPARCNETVSGGPLGRSTVSPSSRPLWIPSQNNSGTPESSRGDRDNGGVALPVSRRDANPRFPIQRRPASWEAPPFTAGRMSRSTKRPVMHQSRNARRTAPASPSA